MTKRQKANCLFVIITLLLSFAAVATPPLSHPAAASGSGWEWQNPPSPWTVLRGVSGYSHSGTVVYAVGNGGTILQYDSSWRPMASGTSNDLNGIWDSTDGTNVYAVGWEGTILRCNDGWNWTPMESNTTNILYGVWGGSATDDVFAVGSGGTIMHYNGSVWSSMESGTTTDYLYGVWGSTSRGVDGKANDVFAVGGDPYSPSPNSKILHYNGSTWTPMTNPATNCLLGVWGTAGNNVFAVGYGGTILHYDGSSWSDMTSPLSDYLTGIWGSSATDIFAVGGGGIILHYDGTSWSLMPRATGYTLCAIWGGSANEIFAVGDMCTALYFDGDKWDPVYSIPTNIHGAWGTSSGSIFMVGEGGTIVRYDSVNPSSMDSGTTNDLYGVWGRAGNDVFAVGTGGTILHYDGTAWSTMTSGTTNSLYGIWGSASVDGNGKANDVFAMGDGGIVLHYDGTNWSSATPTAYNLRGVWGSTGNDVFAVGWNGTILHYNGTIWSTMTSPTTNNLNGVWGSSGTDVFAVGDGGKILHYMGGSSWSAMTTDTTDPLFGVWGSSGTNVFAVGGVEHVNGRILRYNGSSWSSMDTGSNWPFRAVWGSSANNVLALGMGRYHYNGDSWSPISSGSHLHGVWGSSGNNVFAVGDWGTILLYDGLWKPMPRATSTDLYDVWGRSASDVFAVGNSGTILHYDGNAGGWYYGNPGGYWDPMVSNSTVNLLGVWGSASVGGDGIANDVFAVTDIGTVLHYNGSAWSSATSSTLTPLHGIWGSTSLSSGKANDVFAVGGDYDHSAICHYDGSAWSTMTNPTTNRLHGVWGSASLSGGKADDVFAVGYGGTILHYDGSSWSSMDSGTTNELDGIWGSASLSGGKADDVFAVGEAGTILHYNGSAWSSMPVVGTPWSKDIWGSTSLTGGKADDVFAVGDSGAILHCGGRGPTVTNGSGESNVTSNSARLNGEVTDTGNGDPTVHIYWGDNDGGTDSGSWDHNENLGALDAGLFYKDIDTLTPDTDYFYRCFAQNSVGSDWADSTESFTTLVLPQRLIGTDTAGSSSVAAGKLILGRFQATQTGNVTEIRVYSRASGHVKVAIYEDNAGTPTTLLNANDTSPTTVTAGQWNTIPIDSTAITQNAYYWLAVANDNSGATSYSAAGTGTSKGKAITFSSFSFTSNPTGLSSYTYRRAFAGWGNTTPPPLAVTTNAATAVGDGTATLNGTLTGLGTDTEADVYFQYGTDTAYGTSIAADQSPMSSAGNFSVNLTSLTNGQQYHFRAAAEGSPSTTIVLGGDMTFTPGLLPERLIGTDIAGSSSVAAGKLILGKFQATQTGNINEIHVYSRASGKVKVAIYEDSSNSPGNLLNANNAETAVTTGQWNTISIGSTPVTSGNYYWLAVANDNSGATSYNGSGTGISKGKAITFSSFSFTSNPTGLTSYTYRRAFAGWGDITAPTTQRLIGTDTAGSSSVAAGKLILGKFQATQTGNINEIHVYSRASGKVKVAIYEDSSNSPDNLLNANNTETAVTAGQWNTISIGSTPVTSGNYYWLAVANDVTGATSFSTSGGTSKGKAITFSSFSFTSNPTGLTSYTYRRAFAGWGTPAP